MTGAKIFMSSIHAPVTEFADKNVDISQKSFEIFSKCQDSCSRLYAQLKPQEIADIPGVDLVLGASEKFNILNYIDGLSQAITKV